MVLRSLETDERLSIEAPYLLDATELGDLLDIPASNRSRVKSLTDTGEPSAAADALPLAMQGFTHLIAVDYFPGEDHTIARPARYDAMRRTLQFSLGEVASHRREPCADNPVPVVPRIINKILLTKIW